MSEPFDPRDEERTLAALGGMLPRVAPADDLFSRIVAATEGEPPVTVTPFRRRRPGIGSAFAAAALAAAAAVAITLGLQSGSGLGTPTASAPIAAHEHSARVQGSADLYRPNAPTGVLRLRLRDVPAPPQGAHYEVWVLRKGSTQMTAVGSFTPAQPTLTLSLPLPAPGTYAAVDISVQRNDGPPEHSSVSLAGASFTPVS